MKIPDNVPYKIVPNYIGAFDKALPDNYFDMVFSISVLEHINQPVEVLDNIMCDIKRILKPGGYNVHCMDCRFPTAEIPSLARRPMIEYMIRACGGDPQYVFDSVDSPEIFVMSGKAYDRYWKKACNDRSYEVDGLPFSIFVANRREDIVDGPIEITGADDANAPSGNVREDDQAVHLNGGAATTWRQVRPDAVYALSTVAELEQWVKEYEEFIKVREKVRGASDADYMNSNLKLIQDLAICDFASKHLEDGARILEIGGGDSRILTYFDGRFEGWNLDKFEGVGNGPTAYEDGLPYKVVPAYIGAFDERLPDNYFDMVFSISVLEHINEDDEYHQRILDDIDRVLKPGGFNVHCMDCRFAVGSVPSLDMRLMIKYIIKQTGFSDEFIFRHYADPEVFSMSGQAYDRYWKQSCGNRPHEVDGLPFNIFLASKKSQEERDNLPVQESSGFACGICGCTTYVPGPGGLSSERDYAAMQTMRITGAAPYYPQDILPAAARMEQGEQGVTVFFRPFR